MGNGLIGSLTWNMYIYIYPFFYGDFEHAAPIGTVDRQPIKAVTNDPH